MSNAAIYFHPDGYDTTGVALLGRHSAGESFLRGFLRHADVEEFHFFNAINRPIDQGTALIKRVHPTEKNIVWHQGRQRLASLGVLNMPVPGLDEESWNRVPLGEGAYALCGITHTTATAAIMRTLGDMLLAPLHDYDALICTSRAVRDAVESQLAGIREHIEARYGPRRSGSEPQRVTIPLGVNADDFSTSAEARKRWRDELDIPEDAIVALYVGRFDVRAKMNPALMALALEQAAKLTSRRLYWVNSGWMKDPKAEAVFHDQVRALCPSVEYRHVDGRPVETRFSIWSVGDFFLSFSDNIQETFGLTPVEAMAAGLPSVVTDWDGYRDTVRDGYDGFRIPTYAPAPGAGRDLAYAFAAHWLNYDNYVGATGQFTTVDLPAAARAIATLADNADLRRRLGAQARQRAMEVFDWSAIIPQYQALWGEQDARRRSAPPALSLTANPYRPDPFKLFAGYPTQHLAASWEVALPPEASWAEAERVLTSPLASYSSYGRPTLAEARQVFDWLGARSSATVAELVATFPPPRRPFVQRGLLWMARFGAIQLTPRG